VSDRNSNAGSRPHVVHISPSLAVGGVQQVLIGMACAEALRGYRHSILAVGGPPAAPSGAYHAAGVQTRVCRLPLPDSYHLPSYRLSCFLQRRAENLAVRRLAAELRRLNPDLVHSHVVVPLHVQVLRAMREAKRPLLWTLHGLFGNQEDGGPEWDETARLTREAGYTTTAVCRPAAALASRYLGIDGAVQVIHPGADTRRLSPRRSRRPEWRAERGIPQGAILFGTTGRMVKVKAHDILLQAVALLRGEGIDVHVALAGDGPLKECIACQAERLGLTSRVHMLGCIDDVSGFLSELDVFVLPSLSEGFPISLIEALAMGLPCVATRAGGVPELLGSDGGVLVEPGSAPSLAAGMRAMLDERTRAAYVRVGPKIAAQFTHEACAAQFAELYSRLTKPAMAVPAG